MNDPFIWLYVFLGGGVGSTLRLFVVSTVQPMFDHRFATTFPIGTLLVNVLGALAMGCLAALFQRTAMPPATRLALTVGLLGGFTTFSAFAYETYALLAGRLSWAAAANILLSNVLTLAAVWLGMRMVPPVNAP